MAGAARVGFVVLLLAATSCQSQPAPLPQLGIVKGQVVTLVVLGGVVWIADLPTPSPTAGVTVTFSGPQTEISVTSSDGRFSTNLKPGVYVVRLSAIGPVGTQLLLQQGPTTVTVQTGRTTQADYTAYFVPYPPVP